MNGISTALCAAITTDGLEDAPEWLHLVPAGSIRTGDGRGPYRVADAEAVCLNSMKGGKLVLDENHATDLAAPKGGSAPARAWITELQNRADGIWGRADWTGEGRRIVADKQYRGVSPVIAHTKDGTIIAIRRASLTNTPNLSGLVALHSEDNRMDFKAWLIEALGLDADTADDAIVAAMKKKLDAVDKGVEQNDKLPEALQSALAPIAELVGAPKGADVSVVLAGVQQLKDAKGNDGVVTGLQAELRDTATRLNTLVETTSRKDATAFVDGAILAGRVGVKPMRDEYISMHMEDAARAEKLIGAMPIVRGGASLGGTPPAVDKDGIGEADAAVIALMGIDPAEYAKTLGAEKEATL